MGKIWLWRVLAFLVFVGSLVGVEQAFSEERRYLVEIESKDFANNLFSEAVGAELVSKIEWKGRHYISVFWSEESIESLSSYPGVISVEEDPKRWLIRSQVSKPKAPLKSTSQKQASKPNDILRLWGLERLSTEKLKTERAENRKVCIIDSGYNPNHEALYKNPVSYSLAGGWGDASRDKCDHGTHVAGTIVARQQSNGVRGIIADKEIPLHIVKVFNDDCRWAFASDLIKAVQECQNAGANIVNMSLGGSTRSRIEEEVFDEAYGAGVLLVAAAGNDGTSALSYPASYSSVISVGAIDEDDQLADFSQRNSKVELSAPGVGIWSTVNTSVQAEVQLGEKIWSRASGMEGAETGLARAILVDGDRCLVEKAEWKDRIVLCERGGATFWVKTQAAIKAGAVGLVIYNSEEGEFNGTLGPNNKSEIPVLGMDRSEGLELKRQAIGREVELTYLEFDDPAAYASLNGTSMATPHVSGVAALVWSYNPSWTATQVREALCVGSDLLVDPLGSPVPFTGCGVVRADRALEWLRSQF